VLLGLSYAGIIWFGEIRLEYCPGAEYICPNYCDIDHILMGTRSQVMSLTEIFSNFLDFTNNKPKFMEYLKARVEKDKAGSVKNPEVKQKVVDPV